MNESKHGRDQHPRSALLDVAPASDSPSFQRFMWTIDAHLSKRGAKGAARAAAELVLAHLETAASSAKGSQRETDNRDCRLPQIRRKKRILIVMDTKDEWVHSAYVRVTARWERALPIISTLNRCDVHLIIFPDGEHEACPSPQTGMDGN